MNTQVTDSSAEVVADCNRPQRGLAAAALVGEAEALYRPLVVGSVGSLCATNWEGDVGEGLAPPATDRPPAPGGPNSITGPAPTPPGGPATYDRREIAEILAAGNRAWGHPRADELAATLADPAAGVVVTGQQPGIFGGPLLTLVKALAASLWAEKMTAAGTPAVAVFWIAGEDHDFREVSQTSWLVGNDLKHESLGDDDAPLVAVGRRPLGGAIDVLLAEWADSQSSDFWRAEAARLARHYDAGTTFTDAFAGYLVDVLGERCPLLLDAEDGAVKRLQQPALQRLVDERAAVEDRLRRREGEIEAAGFDLQVPSRPETAPLFLHQDGRRCRILWRDGAAGDGGFALAADEAPRSLEELRAAINDAPESVSPSALARPPIQDALLGTSVFVVGPGELAYLAQAAPLYDLLGVTPPTVAVRPSVALAAGRKLEQVAEVGLPVEDLLAGDLDVEAFLATRAGTNPVPPAAAGIERELDELRQQLLAIDPTLEDPWGKTRGNITQALTRLQSRADRTLAQRDQVSANRVHELAALLRPGGKAQERMLSTAWALGRFGADLPDKLAEALDLTPGHMQVIAL